MHVPDDKLCITQTFPRDVLHSRLFKLRQLSVNTHPEETAVIPDDICLLNSTGKIFPGCIADLLIPYIPDLDSFEREALVLNLLAIAHTEDLVEVRRRSIGTL